MARDWESWLQTAARPASVTEEAKRDRTEQRIREAIQASSELPSSVRVYVKGCTRPIRMCARTPTSTCVLSGPTSAT